MLMFSFTIKCDCSSCVWSSLSMMSYPDLKGAIIHSDRGSQYTSQIQRDTIAKYNVIQSMNSDGVRCHDNARCESMQARMKSELFYGCYDPRKITKDELKIKIWRYFMSYWNNRRICSTNGGLPPMVKRRKYYIDHQYISQIQMTQADFSR